MIDNVGKKPTFRHELKYLFDYADAELLKSRIGGMLLPDENIDGTGTYRIRSIYFDDYWDSAYEDKVNGFPSRNKYRLRVYNNNEKIIRLERKTKQGSYILKQSAVLARENAERLLSGDYDFLLKDPQPLCQEFFCECRLKMMKPRVTIDYVRQPYIFAAGDVRITFDMDLQAVLLKFDLFDSTLPTISILPPGQLLLEVKYTEFLPTFIQRTLPQRSSQQASFSKYVLSCEKIMFLKAIENYWYES